MANSSGFPLPIVLGKHSRYCPYCGKVIMYYRNQKKCPGNDCHAVLSHDPPTLPTEFSWCVRCKVGYYQKTWHNCILCNFITPYGHRQNILHAEMNQKIAKIRQQYDQSKVELRMCQELEIVEEKESQNSQPGKESSQILDTSANNLDVSLISQEGENVISSQGENYISFQESAAEKPLGT